MWSSAGAAHHSVEVHACLNARVRSPLNAKLLVQHGYLCIMGTVTIPPEAGRKAIPVRMGTRSSLPAATALVTPRVTGGIFYMIKATCIAISLPLIMLLHMSAFFNWPDVKLLTAILRMRI